MQKAMIIPSGDKLAAGVQCPACRRYVAETRHLARRRAQEAARPGLRHSAANQGATWAVTPLWDLDRARVGLGAPVSAGA
jgi:hypothetical protein